MGAAALPTTRCGQSGGVFVLSLVVLALSARTATAPDPEKVAAHTWRPRLWREETERLRELARYRNHRLLTGGPGHCSGRVVVIVRVGRSPIGIQCVVAGRRRSRDRWDPIRPEATLPPCTREERRP